MANRHTGPGGAAACRTLAEPLARQLGLRIWDVRFVKEGADWFLRVFIDKEGGVSIDDCVDLTRLLSPGPRRGRPDRPVLLPGGLPRPVWRELTPPRAFWKRIAGGR